MTIIAKARPEKRNEFLEARYSFQQKRLAEPGISMSRLYEQDPAA
jgi:hypothetical protein